MIIFTSVLIKGKREGVHRRLFPYENKEQNVKSNDILIE
jgi:hypothetical protein